MTLQVVVVGAGIVGAAISHKVARIGAKVRVLDLVTAPGQGGATRNTWAWINASKKYPQHYRDLNLAGLQRWKSEWPALVHPCGSLVFDDDAGDGTPPDPGDAGCRLDADQVRQLEPALAPDVAARGAKLYDRDAWVDPQLACAAMLRAAEQDGARVLLGPGQRVERLLTRRESSSDAPGGEVSYVTGVLTADGATHPADVVVLAAGTAVQALAAQAGVAVPMLHKPAVVAVTQPLPGPARLMHRLLASAQVFVFQRPDGSCILGDMGVREDGSAARGEWLLQRAAELIPALREAGARVERLEVAYRPWPQDGHPIVGGSSACRGLYIATTHSGVTLAPEVGRLVAEELRHWDVARGCALGSGADLQGVQATLEPYRLERDFEAGASRAAYGWTQRGAVSV